MCSLQATGMDFGVDLEFIWQLEGVVGGLQLGFDNLERTNIVRIEFSTPRTTSILSKPSLIIVSYAGSGIFWFIGRIILILRIPGLKRQILTLRW